MNATANRTFARDGIEYAAVASAPMYSVEVRGSVRSRQHKTGDRVTAGSFARGLAKDYSGTEGAVLLIEDTSRIAQDGSCSRWACSSYVFRNGEWRHLSGAEIRGIAG